MSGYAQVIVDLSAEAVDRQFTYAVPDGMAVTPGQLVAVPFGPRTLEGFVVSLSEGCDLPAERVKPVLRVVREEPVVLPDLMELAEWLHVRYLCNFVDALRLMLPAELRGGRVREKVARRARLALSGEALDAFVEANRRAPKQLEIVEALRAGDADAARFDSAALRALVKKGAVQIYGREDRRTPTALSGDARTADPEPTEEQRRAVARLIGALEGGGGRFLLHGVTGSGKTEVYIRLIRRALQLGKTAIVLVPEIALTPQMVAWLHGRFGGDAAVLHSALSAGERFDEWRRIRSGEARVVIGARSAVFAPVESLGVIIVDEEHESSYIADNRPRYDAREVAAKRCEQAGAVLILGSATPSIATYMRCMPGVKPVNRYELIEMPRRVNGRPLPRVSIVDMRQELVRGNKSVFSGELARAMRQSVDEGSQVILFINRRGYSTFVSCRACGHVERCDQCDVSLTYHQADGLMHCHYCGALRRPPSVCPQCGSRFIRYFGVGTQKVEEEVRKLMPDVAVARMDVDTTSTKDAHEKILSAFRAGETRVLIGTQMIAKGLDFPNVTLVGIVAADLSLQVPDYRAVERTFQLITQVAGRAGRAERPGRVILQTYDPEHYGIQLAARQDYRAFYIRESQMRRRGLYPPFTVLARLLVSSKDEDTAREAATDLESRFREAINAHGGWERDIVQMRALEAPLKILRGEYRWQVFIKMYSRPTSAELLNEMEALGRLEYDGARVELEVNPSAML